MDRNEGFLNESWGKAIIRTLIQLGVNHFCCAPGSRSTPLALAIASDPLATFFIHFDERGVAFHALGHAKGAQKPVAIVATSGTAVANLLPALIEASNERIPLILLTADRPPELRSCGANQTCDQVKLFSPFVRAQIDLPCPDSALPAHYLSATLAHAVSLGGPLHINCMFREPLFSNAAVPLPDISPLQCSSSLLVPANETIALWAERLSGIDEGIILCGSDHLPYAEEVLELSKRLGWPIFADILSPLRASGEHPLLISHCDPLLKALPNTSCKALLQFGNRFCSKALAQWIERQELAFYLHVSDHTDRQDPLHKQTHRLLTSPSLFCKSIVVQKSNTGWASKWEEWNKECAAEISHFFSQTDALTEPGIFHALSSQLDEKWALFLASSMPIRDANQLLAPKHPCGPFFGNRGVSGIDGNIATAAGIAEGCRKPTLAIIGDLTLLHDLNSLAQLKKTKYPVAVLVINNGGGGIFSFLPIAQRKDCFEEFFAAAHNFDFSAAAALFGLPYFHPTTLEELFGCLNISQSCVIEITTCRKENHTLHQQMNACLSSHFSHGAIPALLH